MSARGSAPNVWKVGLSSVVLLVTLGMSHARRSFMYDPMTKNDQSLVHSKVWLGYGDFNHSANWADAHVPCSGDRVVFPYTLRIIAYLGSEPTGTWDSDLPVRIRELQLPRNGIVKLPWEGELQLLGDEGINDHCPGQDVLFTAREDAWLDPDNWEDPEVPLEEKDAVPHLRRVPCAQDVAVFGQPFFRVMLPELFIRVGAIFFPEGQMVYRNQWDWLSTYYSSSLVSPWPEDSPLHLSESREARLDGHRDYCGLAVFTDDNKLLEDAVCQHVSCPVVDCVHPLRPHLHCCPICGGVVELRWDTGGLSPDLSAVRVAVRHALEDAGVKTSKDSDVAVHASMVPTQHGLLQVVALQRRLGEEAQAAAAAIADRLQGWAGYCESSLLLSGGPKKPATLAFLLSSLFLPLVAVIAIVAAIFFYLGDIRSTRALRGQLEASLLFARFENASGADDDDDARIHMHMAKKRESSGTSSSPTAVRVRSARGSWTAGAASRQFQNPLFQDSCDETAAQAQELSELRVSEDAAEKKGHENPLYTELVRREKEMDAAVDDDPVSSTSSSSNGTPSHPQSADLVDINL